MVGVNLANRTQANYSSVLAFWVLLAKIWADNKDFMAQFFKTLGVIPDGYFCTTKRRVIVLGDNTDDRDIISN